MRRDGAVEDWVTGAQVIERLLDFPALRQRAAGCVLHAVRHLGHWCFRRSELEAWIEAELAVAVGAPSSAVESPP